MDAVTLLQERRSVRKFQNKKVSKKDMDEILNTTRFAPSWSNSQTARFNIISSEEIIDRIANEAFGSFEWNSKAVKAAPMVAVVSYELGKSGYGPIGDMASEKGESWGFFDSALATQQFVLAAYEKGVGTVIQGIFDEDKIADILKLPQNEVVACVIPFGYEIEGKHGKAPKRKPVEEIVRYF